MMNKRGVGLAGFAALLLQLLHPVVARALMSTGYMEGDPVARLMKTGKSTAAIVAGEAAEIARVKRIHSHLRVKMIVPAGKWPAGAEYPVNDLRFMLWVLVTLLVTKFWMAEQIGDPISDEAKEAEWQASKPLAKNMGIEPNDLPPTYVDVQVYFHRMMSSLDQPDGDLAMTLDARQLERALGTAWSHHLPVGAVGRLLASALLPENVRQAYGLRWGRLQRLLWWVILTLHRNTSDWRDVRRQSN